MPAICNWFRHENWSNIWHAFPSSGGAALADLHWQNDCQSDRRLSACLGLQVGVGGGHITLSAPQRAGWGVSAAHTVTLARQSHLPIAHMLPMN